MGVKFKGSYKMVRARIAKPVILEVPFSPFWNISNFKYSIMSPDLKAVNLIAYSDTDPLESQLWHLSSYSFATNNINVQKNVFVVLEEEPIDNPFWTNSLTATTHDIVVVGTEIHIPVEA